MIDTLAVSSGVTVTLTWQGIITAGSVVAALSALLGILVKLVKWLEHQKAQDTAIKELKDRHEADTKTIESELAILTYGVLACLKGLQEQGCNGPVSEAVRRIEEYINNKAHEP